VLLGLFPDLIELGVTTVIPPYAILSVRSQNVSVSPLLSSIPHRHGGIDDLKSGKAIKRPTNFVIELPKPAKHFVRENLHLATGVAHYRHTSE